MVKGSGFLSESKQDCDQWFLWSELVTVVFVLGSNVKRSITHKVPRSWSVTVSHLTEGILQN